jgi:protein-S-isoprenylcysteine O-methyltransferase Ste14
MSGMSSGISTRRIVVQSAIGFGIIFALLFGAAGTFAWPEGWLYMLIQFGSSIFMVVWLKRNNPELLKVRAEFWKREGKPWDKAIVILIFATCVPMFILPGLDAVRYQWSHVPLLLKTIGFIGFILSSGLIFWVVKTNPYSSAVVEIQEDREHKTITTGPYEYVRHPMYVGAILTFASIPLALGSLVTFIPAIILTIVIVARTYLEDKTLHQELEGYTAYAETVKHRLIPGVW